jgi:hypothetical protein
MSTIYLTQEFDPFGDRVTVNEDPDVIERRLNFATENGRATIQVTFANGKAITLIPIRFIGLIMEGRR